MLASPRRLNFEDDATITAPGEVHWRQRALPSAFGKLQRAAAMAPRHSAAALRRHGLRLRAALASWRGHTRQARLTITAMVVARARARGAAVCALRSWAGAAAVARLAAEAARQGAARRGVRAWRREAEAANSNPNP